jgi:uncharacterized protein (DUF983 family)
MQSIYKYIPETNHVPKEYNVAAILFIIIIIIIIISDIIFVECKSFSSLWKIITSKETAANN